METKPTTTDQQSRAEFLRSLGLSSAALMAVYCMGTLTACSSNDGNDPAPAPPSSNVDFTLDLNSADFSKLKTIGQFAYRNNIIVARVKDGSYVALSQACTHAGTAVQYRLNEDDFWCNNHGSEFGTNGSVQVGPATRALTMYKTALSADGNQLRVTA